MSKNYRKLHFFVKIHSKYFFGKELKLFEIFRIYFFNFFMNLSKIDVFSNVIFIVIFDENFSYENSSCSENNFPFFSMYFK